MCRFHILCLLIFTCTVNFSSGDDECKKKWPDCLNDKGVMSTNTVCLESGCDPRFQGCLELPSTREFRQGILDKHNELRNKLASGADTRGGNQAASNMMALSYDLDLEYTARCHANMCLFEHDTCRGTKKFPEAGQNLAVSDLVSTTREHTQEDVDKISTVAHFQSLVNEWYEEITLADFTNAIDKYVFNEEAGHFAALIWAETTHVGCATSVDRSKKKETHVYLTCNYGPMGNAEGEPMYKKGSPCSECPSGISCNTKYTAMCGEIDEKAINSVDKQTRDKQSHVLVLAVVISAFNSFHVYVF